MNTTAILQELKSERDRIDQAISALENLNGLPRRGPKPKPAGTKRPRVHVSAAARAKLARLMKQRWAARKKAGKKSLG